MRADLGALGREDECFVEVGAEVPQRVIGDQRHMAEILQHFASNAVKFFATRSDSPAAELRGRDRWDRRWNLRSSTRVSAFIRILPTLFQPFFQVDDTSTRRFGGKGIGLVICRRLAQLLGGEVGWRADSAKAAGSGSGWGRVGTGANPVAASPELDAEAEERRTGELLAFSRRTIREPCATGTSIGWRFGGAWLRCG